MQSWRLLDADSIAADNPYTFYKPSRDIIAQVLAGESVKLIFEFDSEDPEAPRAERMWVTVNEVLDDGRFRGQLDNEPTWIKGLHAGHCIDFAACHIINTDHDDHNNLVEKYIKRCFVTRRVLYDGLPAGYLYRENPDQENDSGWRIMANDESEDYMDDPDNIFYVSLGAVLSRDDSFRELLEAPVGSTYVRNLDSGHFEVADAE